MDEDEEDTEGKERFDDDSNDDQTDRQISKIRMDVAPKVSKTGNKSISNVIYARFDDLTAHVNLFLG